MNVSAGNNAEAESDDDAEELLLKYPVSVLFRCLVLMQQLKNAASLDIIVELASAFALSPDDHCEFMWKIETGKLPIPSRSTLHRCAIKLDYISMHYQRHLFTQAVATNTLWTSQFGGDSSPQVTVDYMSVGTGAQVAG